MEMVAEGIICTLIITAIVIVIINSFCLLVIIVSPALRRSSIILVANLLASHLIQGILVIPSYIAKRWNVGDAYERSAICDTFRFSYMITNYGSCLTLLLIAIDRVLAVFCPYSYKHVVTWKVGGCAIGALWIYVLVLCTLPFLPQSQPKKCTYNPHKIWSATMLTVNTFLPFLLIAFSYILIFKRLRYLRRRTFSKSTRTGSDADSSSQDAQESSQEIAVARMSLMVILAYIICWGPSFFYYLLQSACPSCFSLSYYESGDEEIMTFFMKYMTFINAVIAPGIYCFKHCYFVMALSSLRTKVRQRFIKL